jgi:hypothetical protein
MTDEKKLTWFQLMWKNWLILFAPVGPAFLFLSWLWWFSADTFEIPFTDYEVTSAWFLLILGAWISYLVFYKGWYQFWDDYKKGKSR